MFNYKRAFTLAEVLITLVIIGVIAAISVPTIVANANQKANESRAKKVYSTLANAMTMAKANGADFDFEVANDSNANMKAWYDKYLKSFEIDESCFLGAGILSFVVINVMKKNTKLKIANKITVR